MNPDISLYPEGSHSDLHPYANTPHILGCSYLDKKAPKLSVDSIKDLTEKQAKELLLKLIATK